MRVLSLAALVLCLPHVAWAQQPPTVTIPIASEEVDPEDIPPVLPETAPFIEVMGVNDETKTPEGFRIFADGRYELYGDRIWHREADGDLKWTPLPLGWHPLKTLEGPQVLQVAFAARDSGVMAVDSVIGKAEGQDSTPSSTAEEGEAGEAEKGQSWIWKIRIDGVEKQITVVDYPRVRPPRELEHLYRQVQSIAFD